MTLHDLRTGKLVRGATAALVAIALTLGLAPAPGHAARTVKKTSAAARVAKVAKPREEVPAPPERVAEPVRLLVPPLIKPPAPRPRTQTTGSGQEILTLPAGKTEDTVMMGQRINLPNGGDKVFLRARGLPVQEVLAAISELKNINMVIDPSVGGTVAVDFLDVSLNQVVETLLATNALTMLKMGTAFVIYRSGRYGQAQIKFIPVHFTNASSLVSKITSITGATGISGASNAGGGGAEGGGGDSGFSPQYKLIADARTNSLIVHGTPDDIDIVEKLSRRFDVLMPSKIFRLTHLTPNEAIQLLRNSYFVGAGTGTNAAVSGGGSGAAGGAGAAAGGAGAAAAGGGGAGAATGLSIRELDFGAGQAGTLPALTQINVAVGEATPRFVPLERENNLLVIGSKEEISLVEQILPRIDKKRRQVMLRTQIVELSETAQKSLGTTISELSPNGGVVSSATSQGAGSLRISLSDPAVAMRVQMALTALMANGSAKLLASPTVLAMDNRQSRIVTSEDILSGIQVQQQQVAAGQAPLPPIRTPVFTKVGITLEITPRILLDNSVNLFVHPVVSFPSNNSTTFDGTALTTANTREYSTQELRVRDGETLVIGGLIQERAVNDNRKVPILGDIPIIGVLFSVSSHTTTRSEVQIYITPEIQPDV